MNHTIKWILITILYMFFLPWVIVSSTNSLAFVFVLLYIANPFFSIYLGYISGMQTKKMWFIPILSAVFFILGVLVLFDSSEIKYFYYYAIGYLITGLLSMFFSNSKMIQKQYDSKEKDSLNDIR